jgi:allantoinase
VLDDDEVARIGPTAHCSPPIRDASNRDALWDRIVKGKVDWVASDHSPCPAAKRCGPEPWAGIDGVGLVLSVLLSSPLLDLHAVARLTTAPAARLRLSGKGAIAPGYDGDLVLVDPTEEWKVGPETLLSRHRASPFIGRKLRGKVRQTWRRGTLIYSDVEGPSAAGGGHMVVPTRR